MEIIGSHYKGLKWVMSESLELAIDEWWLRTEKSLSVQDKFDLDVWRLSQRFVSDIDFETGNG